MLIDGSLEYTVALSKGIFNISAARKQSGAAFALLPVPKYWCRVGLNCCPGYLGEVVAAGKSGVLIPNWKQDDIKIV